MRLGLLGSHLGGGGADAVLGRTLWNGVPATHVPNTRVTSPGGLKPAFFVFFRRFWAPGLVSEPSPGLEVQFPVKNVGFGCVCVELSHFSSFSTCLQSCEPLFDDLEFLFFDFETWEGFFACVGRGSLSWVC